MKYLLSPGIYFVIMMGAMVVIDFGTEWFPLDFPGQGVLRKGLAAVGIVFVLGAMISLARSRTTSDPLNPAAASTLVRSGVYRISRNPIYVGLFLLLLSWGLGRDSALGLVMLLPFIVLTSVQIRREERALREKFGEAFTTYCARVRRWI